MRQPVPPERFELPFNRLEGDRVSPTLRRQVRLRALKTCKVSVGLFKLGLCPSLASRRAKSLIVLPPDVGYNSCVTLAASCHILWIFVVSRRFSFKLCVTGRADLTFYQRCSFGGLAPGQSTSLACP